MASKLVTIIITLMSLGLAVGCQVSPLSQYNQVRMGMEKDDVMDLMGAPQRTERLHGKDRWTYIFYDNRIRFEREVQFDKNNVVYIGEPWQAPPEKSAEAIDKRNAELDAKIERENKIEREKAKNSYSNVESYLKGDTDENGKPKIRYMPTFVELK